MRKVFLEDLARKGKLIDWKGSVGRNIRFIYDDIEDFINIKEYIGDQKILLKYKDKEKIMDSYQFKKCFLSEILGKYSKEYQYNEGEIIARKTHFIKIIKQVIYQEKRGYKILCLNCGNVETILESNIKKGVGCNVCIPKPTKILKGVNDISTKAPWMMEYLLDKNDGYKYMKSTKKRVNFKCPECNNIKELRICDVYNYGFSCDACNDGYSIPSKFMFNILKETNVDFTPEYSPKWCHYEMNNRFKVGRYDFYIPSLNLIIEMDGEFHSKDNTMSGQTKEESMYIDKIKDKLALENNINVVRIDCKDVKYEYICNNIMKSQLPKILDFSNVNLKKCYERSQISKMIEVCKIWESGEHSIQKIATKMKIDRHTVNRYLKEGVTLGLCDYSIDEAMKNRRKLTKQVLCVNNSKIYNSIKEIVETSEHVFGIKLYNDSVINVCKGRKSNYKGLIFKYISDLTEEEKIKYNTTQKAS